jgi:tetratricopeptide (TPR) repeat protein
MIIKTNWSAIAIVTVLILGIGCGLARAGDEDIEALSRRELISQHYKQGMTYYRQKEYFQARIEFDKVLILDPEHKRAKRYAKLVFKKIEKDIKRSKPSHRVAGKIIDEKIDMSEYLYELGKNYYLLGKNQEAIKKFEQALLVNSTHKGAQIYLEQVQKELVLKTTVAREMTARKEAKLEARRRKLEQEKGKQQARDKLRAEKEAKKKARDAEREAKKEAKEAKTEERPEKLSRQYQEAIVHFQKALELRPGYSTASKYLEKSQRKLEEQKAKSIKEEIREKEKQARKEAKLEARRRKLEQEKGKQQARDKLRAEKEAKKKARDAEREAEKEAKEAKTEERPEKLKAEVEREQEKKKRKRLAKEITKAEKLKKEAEEKFLLEKVEGYYLEGKDCYRSRQYSEAIRLFQKALELKPDYTKASRYLKRSRNKLEKEKRKEVKSYYREGRKFYSNHQYEEAIAKFQKALELDPDYSAAAKYLKKAKKKMGNLLTEPR